MNKLWILVTGLVLSGCVGYIRGKAICSADQEKHCKERGYKSRILISSFALPIKDSKIMITAENYYSTFFMLVFPLPIPVPFLPTICGGNLFGQSTMDFSIDILDYPNVSFEKALFKLEVEGKTYLGTTFFKSINKKSGYINISEKQKNLIITFPISCRKFKEGKLIIEGLEVEGSNYAPIESSFKKVTYSFFEVHGGRWLGVLGRMPVE